MTKPIDTMTDAELTRLAGGIIEDECVIGAEGTVMRWDRLNPNPHPPLPFCPLVSWNDCFLVVTAMRAKGWLLSFRPELIANSDQYRLDIRFTYSKNFRGRWVEVGCDINDEATQRRGILKAAVLVAI